MLFFCTESRFSVPEKNGRGKILEKAGTQMNLWYGTCTLTGTLKKCLEALENRA